MTYALRESHGSKMHVLVLSALSCSKGRMTFLSNVKSSSWSNLKAGSTSYLHHCQQCLFLAQVLLALGNQLCCQLSPKALVNELQHAELGAHLLHQVKQDESAGTVSNGHMHNADVGTGEHLLSLLQELLVQDHVDQRSAARALQALINTSEALHDLHRV